MKPSRPNREGLRARVRDFFARNPTEVLEYADITAKFGCTYDQACKAVGELQAAGFVRSTRIITAADTAKAIQ